MIKISNSISIEEVSIYEGAIFYGPFKQIVDILDYIKKYTDLTIVYEKRSPTKLYIVDREPRKEHSK